MKKTLLTFCLFVPVFCYAQLRDDFADGNFTDNPVWKGAGSEFIVNAAFELQSAAAAPSVSSLFTPSPAIDNASWEVSLRINYSTSSSNYACVFLAASAPENELPDLAALNGFFVMVGGTADEVSLYRQQGAVKTRLIDGADKRTDGKVLEIRIKVLRDSTGTFKLYSKLASENNFFFEGEAEEPNPPKTEWFGLLFSNTATTGNAYFFDDVVVTGQPLAEQPELLPGVLCFNELMINAPDGSAEYIELYNRSDQLLRVGGLVFATKRDDGSFSAGTVLPSATVIKPAEYLAFTPDTAAVRIYHQVDSTAGLVQCKWTTLPNEEASLFLLDPVHNRIVDSVFYSQRMHHVLIHDPKGVALEKMHPDLASSDRNAWHSAASEHRYGTPGMRNSQFRVPGAASGEVLWLEQGWFSPDNDGVSDRCILRYTMPGSGYALRVAVLTPDGAPWYEITSGELLSTEGFIAWDGQNAEGRISMPGIYILVAELFHTERAVTKRYKMAVLLTIR